MIPSDLEFRYADLTGDVFQVRNEWTVMQLLEEYRPELANSTIYSLCTLHHLFQVLNNLLFYD
jgi:hypothetical protein